MVLCFMSWSIWFLYFVWSLSSLVHIYRFFIFLCKRSNIKIMITKFCFVLDLRKHALKLKYTTLNQPHPNLIRKLSNFVQLEAWPLATSIFKKDNKKLQRNDNRKGKKKRIFSNDFRSFNLNIQNSHNLKKFTISIENIKI